MNNTIIIIIALFLTVGISSCIYRQKSNNKKETEDNQFDFEQVYTLALQENMAGILELLDSVPNSKLTDEQIEAKGYFYRRFRYQNEKYDYKTNDSLIINVVELFYSYWRKVLLDSKAIASADTELKAKLADYLYETNYISSEISRDSLIENLGDYLMDLLTQKGFYSNALGKTGNFYDLFLWAKETEKIYEINLPETDIKVKVIFMEDFISNGWSYYATFGVYYAGGWATRDALYCVKKAYDISSENFMIDYLTHEAQHFADYKLFPKLAQPDLEYRAKLVQLSKKQETLYNMINTLIIRSKNDRKYAHPFANFCVIRDLSKEIFNQKFVSDMDMWEKVSYQEINKASIKLIKQHTTNLNNAGAESVTEFIK
jgi:hypothetical protein